MTERRAACGRYSAAEEWQAKERKEWALVPTRRDYCAVIRESRYCRSLLSLCFTIVRIAPSSRGFRFALSRTAGAQLRLPGSNKTKPLLLQGLCFVCMLVFTYSPEPNASQRAQRT